MSKKKKKRTSWNVGVDPAAPGPGQTAFVIDTSGKRTISFEGKEISLDETGRFLTHREETYGNAWQVTDSVQKFLLERGLLDKIQRSGYFFAWFMCLNKLIRLLFTPNHVDSWVDIEGYARLVIDELDPQPTVNVPEKQNVSMGGRIDD